MSENSKKAMQLRRSVVGDEFVDRWLGELDDVTEPLDALITDYAWGAVWSRPGLGLRERSLITIAVLAAGKHSNELKVHLRGAINNGCSRLEITEALLQVAPYAGIPAARDALLIAKEFFKDLPQDTA